MPPFLIALLWLLTRYRSYAVGEAKVLHIMMGSNSASAGSEVVYVNFDKTILCPVGSLSIFISARERTMADLRVGNALKAFHTWITTSVE